MSDIHAADTWGAGNRSSDNRRRRGAPRVREWMTVAHVSVFVIASTWAFGGQADWVRGPLTAWGCLGFPLMLAQLLRRDSTLSGRTVALWIAPIAAFNAIVLVAMANPSFTEIQLAGETMLAATGGNPHWPSSAQPALARYSLLQFDAIWVSCFNLALVLSRRRLLRTVLLIVVLNTLILAVFGTVQKLSGATGLFFGAVASPQNYFFASFVYHNHWGAYALLAAAVTFGLTRHLARRQAARDMFHSPAFMGVAIVLIIIATIPLSGSRSSTLLAVALLGGAFVHAMATLVRRRRHFNESILPPVVVATAALLLAGSAIWYLGRETIRQRVDLTQKQITSARRTQAPDQRVQLYRDTWQMAMAKPWFGWGMASYPHVFTVYNTRAPIPHFPVFYHDAHSDWLQALAEHGIVGSALLTAAALLPVATLRRRRSESPLTWYPIGGCALVVAYATLEFPFGNFAVTLTWWVCLFSAIQYGRLTALQDSREADPRSMEG